jgi:hypothetical protein
VPGDQGAVLRDHDVRLDEVGPHFDCHLVGFKGVFREVAARPSVSDDKRLFAGERLLLGNGRAGKPRRARASAVRTVLRFMI